MRLTQIQISLRIPAVWSESSFSSWRNFASLVISNAPSEDSNQITRMRRLFWIFAECIWPKASFLRLLLNWCWIIINICWISQRTTKPTIRLVRPAKTQISLRIRAVWSESSLIARAFYSRRAYSKGINENPCDTEWIYRLIWVFAGHTGLTVGVVVR